MEVEGIFLLYVACVVYLTAVTLSKPPFTARHGRSTYGTVID
jgi:hypothetical protein